MKNVKQKQPIVQAAINKSLSGGGSSGTSDYTDLENKPQINSVTLSGNKTTSDLGIDAVPEVTSNDNGKVLTATYSGGAGTYDWANKGVPTVTSNDDGKILTATYSGGTGTFAWATAGNGMELVESFDVTPTSTSEKTNVWEIPSPTTVTALYLIFVVYNGKKGHNSADVCYLSTTATPIESTVNSNPTLSYSLFNRSNSLSSADYLQFDSSYEHLVITGIDSQCIGKIYKLI